MTFFHIAWTIALLVAFILIVAWVVNPKRKKRFDEAAELPFDEREGDDR